MTTLVTDSIHAKKPIIAVSVQYRLNVFALGNGTGPANLGLRDQALALEWVQKHISGFGGDPVSVIPGFSLHDSAPMLRYRPRSLWLVRVQVLYIVTLILPPTPPSGNIFLPRAHYIYRHLSQPRTSQLFEMRCANNFGPLTSIST